MCVRNDSDGFWIHSYARTRRCSESSGFSGATLPKLTTLIIGDIDRREFRDAIDSIESASRLVRSANVASAVACVDDGEVLPDLIVLAQARPGEHHPDLLDRLRASAVLAPIVVLLGPWGEGETRSGEPLSGVLRVCWHQWRPWFEQQMALFARGKCPVWGLPPTATEEERLLWQADPPMRAAREGTIAIVARHSATAEWLRDACTAFGWRCSNATVGLKPDSHHIDAVIWDMVACDDDEADLAVLRDRFAIAAIVLLTGFPRAAERARLMAAGAAAVLSKPLTSAFLETQLDRLISTVPALARHWG
jgi:DNA-binding response OmpR family regulator